MKVKNRKVDLAEGDLTPMIDMTFQLIAFFMVLINFTQTESHERVVLPSSNWSSRPRRRWNFRSFCMSPKMAKSSWVATITRSIPCPPDCAENWR